MNKLLLGGAVILFSGLAGTAMAALITWDTDGGAGTTAVKSGSSAGNYYTFTTGGQALKAHAYATNTTGGSGTFQTATLNLYSGGLGITSQGESTVSPDHAIDNNGKNELLVFEFSNSLFDPASFQIGWKDTDSDIRWWIGGASLGANYDFTGKTFSNLLGLGFTSYSSNNVPINTSTSLIGSDVGRYLIFAPALYNTGGSDRNYDYFKISQITGQYLIQLPQNPVSEPGTAALLGIALAGLWANRRRKS